MKIIVKGILAVLQVICSALDVIKAPLEKYIDKDSAKQLKDKS